jgi:ABC-type transport system involved in multi-copper enzyme maturation permease subunit
MNVFLIAFRTLYENLSLKSTWIYGILILIFSVIFGALGGIGSVFKLSSVFAEGSQIVFFWYLFFAIGFPFLIFVVYMTLKTLDRDLESGVSLLIFTRPITRAQYLIGKFIGLVMYFFILNLWLFLFATVIMNIFVGIPSEILSSLYLFAFIFLILSLFIAIFFITLVFMLYIKFKRVTPLLIIFVFLILALYILPLISVNVVDLGIPNILKAIISILGAILLPLGIFFTDPGYFFLNSFGNIFLVNKVGESGLSGIAVSLVYDFNLFAFLIPLILLSIVFFVIAIWIFKKQDIY